MFTLNLKVSVFLISHCYFNYYSGVHYFNRACLYKIFFGMSPGLTLSTSTWRGNPHGSIPVPLWAKCQRWRGLRERVLSQSLWSPWSTWMRRTPSPLCSRGTPGVRHRIRCWWKSSMLKWVIMTVCFMF